MKHTNTCAACLSGLVEDGWGCRCPEQGPVPFELQKAELVKAYFMNVASPREAVVDTADFFALYDPSNALPTVVVDETEDEIRLFVRSWSREACEECGGRGKVPDYDDDRYMVCPDCDGSPFHIDAAPKVLIGHARGQEILTCGACGCPTEERAAACPCGVDFIVEDLELQLRRAVLARTEPHNDERRALRRAV